MTTGDVSNVPIWPEADVYIDLNMAGTMPADVSTEWGTEWSPVGLLNGEEGTTETREQETTNHFAWGGILIRRIRSQHQRTFAFVALEDNETVFQLVNPGSPAPETDTKSGLITREVMVPKPQKFNFGMEFRDPGSGKIKRRFTDSSSAELSTVGERTENETGVGSYTITVILYPNADGDLYTELEGTTSGT